MFAHGGNELRSKEMNLRDGLVSEEAIRDFRHSQIVKPQVAAQAPVPSYYSNNPYAPLQFYLHDG
jgi:hypothetical protein